MRDLLDLKKPIFWPAGSSGELPVESCGQERMHREERDTTSNKIVSDTKPEILPGTKLKIQSSSFLHVLVLSPLDGLSHPFWLIIGGLSGLACTGPTTPGGTPGLSKLVGGSSRPSRSAPSFYLRRSLVFPFGELSFFVFQGPNL